MGKGAYFIPWDFSLRSPRPTNRPGFRLLMLVRPWPCEIVLAFAEGSLVSSFTATALDENLLQNASPDWAMAETPRARDMSRSKGSRMCGRAFSLQSNHVILRTTATAARFTAQPLSG